MEIFCHPESRAATSVALARPNRKIVTRHTLKHIYIYMHTCAYFLTVIFVLLRLFTRALSVIVSEIIGVAFHKSDE